MELEDVVETIWLVDELKTLLEVVVDVLDAVDEANRDVRTKSLNYILEYLTA